MNKLWAFLFLLNLFTAKIILASEPVGKVSYLRGSAFANDQKIELNQEIFVADKIKTEKKSVVKIKLIDESTIIVAPSSSVNIDEINQKTKASLISVLKGSLRAVVPKKVKKNKLNKLVIKSPMAAFGVRGTDFLVGHNKTNSHIITFSGLVKVTSLDSIKRNLKGINKILEKSGTLISKGEFSSIKKGDKNFTRPIKINRTQFFALRRNDQFSFNKKTKQKPKVKLHPKSFPKQKIQEVKAPTPVEQGRLPGGYVEINTGTYISPDPKTSKYDPVNKVFIPGKEQGQLNSISGEFEPTKDLKKHKDGEVINNQPNTKNKQKEFKKDNQNNGADTSKSPAQYLKPPMSQNGIIPSSLFQNQQQNNNQEFSLPPSTNVRIRIRNGE
jgi:hypothetical protein